jgi:hypothetical protein
MRRSLDIKCSNFGHKLAVSTLAGDHLRGVSQEKGVSRNGQIGAVCCDNF